MMLRAAATAATSLLVLVGGAHAASAAERSYEMVSPVEKQSFDVLAGTAVATFAMTSESGDAITYGVIGAFPGAPSNLFQTFFRSARLEDPLSWATQSITPPQVVSAAQSNQRALMANSRDLSRSVVGSTAALAPGAVAGNGNLYVRDNVTNTYELVATSPAPGFIGNVTGSAQTIIDAATPDLSHFLFTVGVALTPDAVPGRENVYEWDGSQLSLVSVVDGVGVAAYGAALSDDGSRAFFETVDDGAAYVHERGKPSVVITVSRRAGDPSTPQRGQIRAISADGNRVLVRSAEPLTDESTATGASTGAGDLYLYIVDTDHLEDITTTDPTGARLYLDGFVGASDDATRAYFFAQGVLAPGATANQQNLYAWSADGIEFIATTVEQFTHDPSDAVINMHEVSPNGRYVVFRSVGNLTGYDSTSAACAPAGSPAGTLAPCGEVYRYSADSGLICISCGPAGVSPRGDAVLGGQSTYLESFFPGYYPRGVLDDGTVFFDSPDALQPADTNNKYDAYMYRDGSRSLISTGRSDDDSRFSDASASGDNVFFTTREALVGQDVDRLMDMYDARVGGGIAGQNPPTPAPPCGDNADCRAGGVPPVAAAPLIGSITFTGAGNAAGSTSGNRAPSASVSVSKVKAVTGSVATIKVKVPGAGSIKLSGSSVQAATKRTTRAATYSVRVALSAKAKAALKRKRTLKARVKVAFTPTAGTPASKAITVTFKQPKATSTRSRVAKKGR